MPGLLAASVARAPAKQLVNSVTTRGCASWASRTNPVYPSLWNKWFPHEPVPSSPKVGPYKVLTEEGKVYYWCSCGESATQPWCPAPGGTNCAVKKFVPRLFEPKWTGVKYMCGCKKTPHHNGICNGSCGVMWCDLYPMQASGIGFVGCFIFGVFTTWFWHP
mmetsp:Transcript_60394/g.143970  ORF Transcript_60394/g.143970 Transcript_60394/m.143970 type:complete len:162 (+) Transcript_60394:125-610(+)|eukprot:CAMPEP_0178421470 /NCGR_PEP_ID=MMETSP0689_2-20121128/26664_1 /TAXON_ID=160604 /ORGANISM="Amphidinium massartii, Strain CS-259" /LENGTH=161 /DNA_ID=CAMNT_0020042983 /DNA_START=125 /DNA_END=610 /DNA_ORIENTATION=-